MRPDDPPSSNGHRSIALEAAVDLADVLNGAVNRLYGAGLSVAAVLSRTVVDDDARGHLCDVLVELDGVVAELRTAAFGRLVSDGQPGRSLPVYVEDSYAHPAPHPSLAPAPAIMPNPRMTTLEDVIE